MAGFQEPVMPLVDVVGNTGIEVPTQYGPTAVKAGVSVRLTTTDVVVWKAAHPELAAME